MNQPYPCSGNFIPTNFALNDEAKVEHQGDIVSLGFYGQDGKTYTTHGMTVEAARAIAMEMLAHCDQAEGVHTVAVTLPSSERANGVAHQIDIEARRLSKAFKFCADNAEAPIQVLITDLATTATQLVSRV